MNPIGWGLNQGQGQVMMSGVKNVKRSTVGSRAFPVAGPKTSNALPEDVTFSQCKYTFHRQLKTWLFRNSLPDIVI